MTLPHPDVLRKIPEAPELTSEPQLRRSLGISRRRGLNDGVIYPEVKPAWWWSSRHKERALRSAAESDGQPVKFEGKKCLMVVLVEFADQPFDKPIGHYKDLFFGTRGRSVQSYFKEVSNSKVDIAGDVFGPFKVPHGEAHYSDEKGSRALARTAAEAVKNSRVDFSKFDGDDRDNFVDGFVVVHAGVGAENLGGSKSHIHSHKDVFETEFSADGKKVFAYAMVAKSSPLGVLCHELGHLLFRWPDLYGEKPNYHSGGVGNWCLMSSGNWNGNTKGESPAHPSAWCKLKLGWVRAEDIQFEQVVHLEDIKRSGKVARLWPNGRESKEYFLVENRSKNDGTFDECLPGKGLLVWHIDEDMPDNNTLTRPKVALVQADGASDLQKMGGEIQKWGDEGDPFPGSKVTKKFVAESNPSSRLYSGRPSGIRLEQIQDPASTVVFRASVSDIPIS